MSRKVCIVAAAAFFLLRPDAQAEVTDSSAAGFTVHIVMQVAAPPEKVYDRVVNDVGLWWSSGHTFSGNAQNLSINGTAGGCFCEKLSNGGSVRHMVVVFASPGNTLRLEGGLGPLQALSVSGSMTWTFKPAPGGTKLDVTYAVGGYTPGGLQKFSGAVDSVLKEQIVRLKNLIETGAPEGESHHGK